MSAFKQIGLVAIASVFALALAIDAADARRGGGGGMRAGGFSGGGIGAGGGRAGFSGGGPRGPHVSNPIARPGIGNRPGQGPGWAGGPGNRPGWGTRPGYGPGYGYRPGYGWGAAAALGAGAGLAYSGYGSGYGYYDDVPYQSYELYEVPSESDAIAECAARFKTYDPASQLTSRARAYAPRARRRNACVGDRRATQPLRAAPLASRCDANSRNRLPL